MENEYIIEDTNSKNTVRVWIQQNSYSGSADLMIDDGEYTWHVIGLTKNGKLVKYNCIDSPAICTDSKGVILDEEFDK